MNNGKLIFAVLVIFAAGVVTGGLLVNHVQRHKWPAQAQRGAAVPPLIEPGQVPAGDLPRLNERELQVSLERRRMEFILGATRELKLTPEQRERVEKIIRESHERTRKFWEQVGPQMRREMNEVRTKIVAELTADQRTRFEELMKRPQGQPQGMPFLQQQRRGDDNPGAGEGRKRDPRRSPGPREGGGPDAAPHAEPSDDHPVPPPAAPLPEPK